MDLLRCKARLAVLWVMKAIGFSVFLFLGMMKYDTMENMWNAKGLQVNDATAVVFGFLWWIPLIMAWLSMTLKGSANRWSNFVLGIIMGVLVIFDMVGNASISSPAMVVDFIFGILICGLIAWYAWKLPKEEVKQTS
jgi:hypothetical protein